MDIIPTLVWITCMIIAPILFFVALLFTVPRILSKRVTGDARVLEEQIKHTNRNNLLHVTSFIGNSLFQEVSNTAPRNLTGVSVAIFSDSIALYDESLSRKLILRAPFSSLRGVFLSEGIYNKYHYSLEFHFYHNKRWQFLHLPMETLKKRDFSALLNHLYNVIHVPGHSIHRNRRFPVSEVRQGHFATRKLTGEWLYKAPVYLCLTPLYLVITSEKGELQHSLSTLEIIEIELLPNLNNALDSVMRLTMHNETSFEIGLQGMTYINKIAKVAAERQQVPLDDILKSVETRKKFAEDNEKLKRDEGA